MPEFVDPFSGLVPRQMTKQELVRALRLNLAAELEAVHLYLAHAEATDDALARRLLVDIANEERQHAGEFLELLARLAPDEQHFLDLGRGEVKEMAADSAPALAVEAPASPASVNRAVTIGSLRPQAGEEE